MIYGWDSRWHDTFVRFIGQILDKKTKSELLPESGVWEMTHKHQMGLVYSGLLNYDALGNSL